MKKNYKSKEILKKIGSRIKSIRLKFSMGQKEFAKKLGISQSFLSFVEKGLRKPSLDLFLSLVLYLRVNLEWIMTGEGEIFIRGNERVRWQEKFEELFPGVPSVPEVINLVKSLEVPIMRNALVEKYFLYRKRYEDFIIDHYSEKEKKGENMEAERYKMEKSGCDRR